LRLYGSVTISGAFSADEDELIVGQGPDGAVFVAGPQSSSGAEVIWVVDGTNPATIAEHLSEPAYSIAADATYLYIGFARTINAYSRTTGSLVRSWKPSASIPGERVQQIVVAGNRIWGLYTTVDSSDSPFQAGAEGAVEINPAVTAIVREVPDIADAFSVAATGSGIYYVYDQSAKVQEQTNDGHTVTQNTNQQVNIELSGRAAIQAVAVFGGEVILQHDAGQGLDAVLDAYNATTLAGPTMETDFSANEQLIATPTGMFVVGTPDTTVCAATQQQCVARFALGSAGATDPVALPTGALTSELSGPYPTVVLGVGNDLQLLRIG
jgi:hypothetical protein